MSQNSPGGAPPNRISSEKSSSAAPGTPPAKKRGKEEGKKGREREREKDWGVDAQGPRRSSLWYVYSSPAHHRLYHPCVAFYFVITSFLRKYLLVPFLSIFSSCLFLCMRNPVNVPMGTYKQRKRMNLHREIITIGSGNRTDAQFQTVDDLLEAFSQMQKNALKCRFIVVWGP